MEVYEDDVLVAEGYWQDLQPVLQIEEWKDSFELYRKNCIRQVIRDVTERYLNHANPYGEKFGLEYRLRDTTIDNTAWNPELDRLSLLVFYQEHPFGNAMSGYYNRLTVAGAGWKKGESYEGENISADNDYDSDAVWNTSP